MENSIKSKTVTIIEPYTSMANDSSVLSNIKYISNYEGRTESHEQLFFACKLGTADEGEYGGRWNQLLCYP